MATMLRRATVDDLYRVEGKAELIDGRIVRIPHGAWPNLIAGNICASLREHVKRTRLGKGFMGGLGCAVPELASGRELFCPDASYLIGPFPANEMRFIEVAPTFAVEVRTENDYGPHAESEIAAKRVDYFQAGTLVVWDVDLVSGIVAVYRHTEPQKPTVFRRGEVADAEPAVPGWQMPIDDVFER